MADKGAEIPQSSVVARKKRRVSKKNYSNAVIGGNEISRHRDWLMRASLASIGMIGGIGSVVYLADQAIDLQENVVRAFGRPGSEDADVEATSPSLQGISPEFTAQYVDTAKLLGLDRTVVEEFKTRLLSKEGYWQQHGAIPRKYEDFIRQAAEVAGISAEMVLGIIAVENGGSEDEINPITGARGVAQLLAQTARERGLIVEGDVDQRSKPLESIDAAVTYLAVNFKLFNQNPGLTAWSYHAGPGTVFRALQVYIRDTEGVDIGSYGYAIQSGNYHARESIEAEVKKRVNENFRLQDLFNNPAVKSEVLDHLEDNSADYVPAVAAAAELLLPTGRE